LKHPFSSEGSSEQSDHINRFPVMGHQSDMLDQARSLTGKPILAGVDGYAASFIHEHIPNAAVFAPRDTKAAVQAFKRQDKSIVDRSAFVRKYSRTEIMEKMAHEISSYSRENQ
jgi:hypothetical protein